MHFPGAFFLALLPSLALAHPHPDSALEKRSQTLIPTSCFDSTSALTTFFEYHYPWGQTHNGAAIMWSGHSQILSPGTLTLWSTYTGSSPYSYDSGTVYAKQQFTVAQGSGLTFSADFIAPVAKGTWPAFWLTGANSWPPEVDIAEWKGNGMINFNTFNTSSAVQVTQIPYNNPGSFHTIRAVLEDENGSDVSIKFYMDGQQTAHQYAHGLVGQPLWLIIDLQMEGSSGSPGPKSKTNYEIKNLQVTQP
ncbi:hypothetical protein UA08_09302 [Talaromyces atroroseus]|uniref:GH16 domain-containing protein n=1 Tax=Talaromyces atroroseus TaxID=1441469 RepID=A0A1Q5Q6G2_TALAT|nr:hypothetical protein UA08_09302 [Talaromyces atroroseus]OKL55436.1 hypothetical protein UA08_09302 [Talaromyces atroroseus]